MRVTNAAVINLGDFRPPTIPPEISSEELIEAVRDFLHGDAYLKVAEKLHITVPALQSIQRGRQWRELQNFVRDEFMLGMGSRMLRIENKLLDKIEGYVDDGLEVVGQTAEGEEFRYQRQLTPKECVSVALMMNEVNKRIDKVKTGDATRKTFDPEGWLKKLESAAKVVREREVEGQATREPD